MTITRRDILIRQAASELLDACVAVDTWIAQHGEDLPPSAVTLARIVYAAIAKAGGRS